MAEVNQKNILVTGGAGFIGSNLCDILLGCGHSVICLDNLLTGSIENISGFKKNPNFKFIKHDIINPFYDENIDEIYNLACPASPVQYQNNAIKTIKTCTIGVINMLELAKRNNAKILQASTSEVYGNPIEHPQNELYFGNVNTVGLRSCYDEGKRCAETLFMDYYRKYNLKIKIVRIFNTYGPNMAINDGRVISNFVNQVLNEKEITIYGDGKQTRSFMYVDDLVRGLIKMMNSSSNITGPINLGNPDEISIYDLSQLIKKLVKSDSTIKICNLPPDDPVRRKPDIQLANKILKWFPKIKIEFGLKETINYFSHLKH